MVSHVLPLGSPSMGRGGKRPHWEWVGEEPWQPVLGTPNQGPPEPAVPGALGGDPGAQGCFPAHPSWQELGTGGHPGQRPHHGVPAPCGGTARTGTGIRLGIGPAGAWSSTCTNCSLPRRAAVAVARHLRGSRGAHGHHPGPRASAAVSPGWSIPCPTATGMAPSTSQAGTGEERQRDPGVVVPLRPPCALQSTRAGVHHHRCTAKPPVPRSPSRGPHPGVPIQAMGPRSSHMQLRFGGDGGAIPGMMKTRRAFPQGEGVPRPPPGRALGKRQEMRHRPRSQFQRGTSTFSHGLWSGVGFCQAHEGPNGSLAIVAMGMGTRCPGG